MGYKPIPRVCGSCAYLVTEEDEPYYCAMRDLYTFVKATDKVCEEYLKAKENGKD